MQEKLRGAGGARLVVLAAVAAGALGVACSKKDPAKCQEATSVVRQSLQSEDTALARQWRDRAYTYCEQDGTLASLDQEISTKEQAILTAKADKEKKEAEVKKLIGVLGQLATQAKSDPTSVVKGARCPEEKDAEGWCQGSRTISGTYTVEVRYWNKDPKAVSLWTKPRGVAKCDMLGATSIHRKWASTIDGAVAKFHHCTIPSGDFAGMQAMVGWSDNLSLVQVFTPEYRSKDAALNKRVSGN